jgi:hypothetical protein
LKILVISDIHAREESLEFIERVCAREKPALVAFLGDYTNYGKPIELVPKILDAAEKHAPVIALFGNLDSAEVKNILEKKKLLIHGRKKMIGGVEFVGFGGTNPTPFNTPIEFSEEEIKEGLAHLVSNNTFLLTHFPPHETNADAVKADLHVGSTALRKIIEEKQPLACACGHIHETAGVEWIGKTKIIKVPSFKDRFEAMTVEIPSLEVKVVE